ncbi:MAG: M20/M25/M40 family metallo-hydrolase [Bacteroidales bacterium]|nr:M20/M25/M40 family metallo-hydrolase [Bacteroidales bacterium]
MQILTADAVGLLKEMVAIPSPSFSESAVCEHICEWMTDRGIVHEKLCNNIIAEHITDKSKPTLMLCAHIDTVSPSEGYEFDPYEPHDDVAADVIGKMTGQDVGPDDIIAGLGSNDDGASVVSMIAAYRAFSSDDKNVILVLTCEEERSGKNGMTGLWGKRFCERGANIEDATEVDYAIVGEPTGMKAATSERGLLVIDATAHGQSGHAARNEGVNAMYIALEDIAAIRAHEFERISSRMGKVNMNVTQINAGTAHNVIPDRCDFVIDIRPTEQYTNEEILQELQSICRSELKPRNLSNRSSATYDGSRLQEITDALGIATFSSPTTSDWMRITCDAIKMGPGDSARSHRKNEFVFTDEIRKGIEGYIEFINNL